MTRRPEADLAVQRGLLAMVVAAWLCAAGGCGSYRIEGRVVASQLSTLLFVDATDPKLEGPGVAGAEIKVYRDPMRPNAALVARTVTGPDGRFSLPIDAFGAGWMEEQWRIEATRPRYQPVDLTLSLPRSGAKRRLLIMLAPGDAPPRRDDPDPMELFERYR